MKVLIVRCPVRFLFEPLSDQGFEESFPLKRNVLLLILAAASIALPTLNSAAQTRAAAQNTDQDYKNEVSIGYGYTALNQVNNSRYGLQGVDASYARGFGKYFNLRAEGDYYGMSFKTGLSSTSTSNPGDPSVVDVLAGPEFHSNLYGRFGGSVRFLIGGEHTGGESMTPDVSFSTSYGVALDYKLNKRFALRGSGEKNSASFSMRNNSTNLGYSSHRSSNVHAAFSLVYHF